MGEADIEAQEGAAASPLPASAPSSPAAPAQTPSLAPLSLLGNTSSGKPAEYLVLEFAVREIVGRKMADMAIGHDCCGQQEQLPENVPGLERVASLLHTIPERIPELAKKVIGKNKTLGPLYALAEEIVADAEYLVTKTATLYTAHRESIYALREQHVEEQRLLQEKTLEEHLHEVEKAADETKHRRSGIVGLIGKALSKKENDKEPAQETHEHMKDPKVDFGQRYFAELTSRIPEQEVRDYLSTGFRMIRKASRFFEMSPSTLNWPIRDLFERGQEWLVTYMNRLVETYTCDGELVLEMVDILLPKLALVEPEELEEGLAWLEGAADHVIGTIYTKSQKPDSSENT